MEEKFLAKFEKIVYDNDIIMVVFKNPTFKRFNVIVNRRRRVGSLARFLYENQGISYSKYNLLDSNSRKLDFDKKILEYCERGEVLILDIKFNDSNPVYDLEKILIGKTGEEKNFTELKKDTLMVEKSPEKNNEILDQNSSRNSVTSNEKRNSKIKKSKKKKNKKKKKKKKLNRENANN